MDCKRFVRAFKEEQEWQMRDYFSEDPKSVSGVAIQKLGLSEEQTIILKEAFDSCLTDTYYTVLLALDGSTAIGSMQHTFKIYDEADTLLSECGDLEAEAFEQFHGEGKVEASLQV